MWVFTAGKGVAVVLLRRLPDSVFALVHDSKLGNVTLVHLANCGAI